MERSIYDSSVIVATKSGLDVNRLPYPFFTGESQITCFPHRETIDPCTLFYHLGFNPETTVTSVDLPVTMWVGGINVLS